MNSYNTPTPSFDNLLIQALMGKLQINSPHLPSTTTPPPFLSQQSLEDLLLNNLSDNDDDSSSSSPTSSKTHLAKEEAKLEKEIIRIILSGKTEILKPNSGQAVTVGEHHICVGFHEDTGSDYRVWEWHGHIMLFDEEMDYKLEYIYGNYFERVIRKAVAKEEEKDESGDNDDDDDEKVGNLGLRELIESGESNGGRILHRNINAGSPRF